MKNGRFIEVNMEKLSKEVKRFRDENGLTQIQLAVKTDLSLGTIANIEQGSYSRQIGEGTYEKLKEIGVCIENL